MQSFTQTVLDSEVRSWIMQVGHSWPHRPTISSTPSKLSVLGKLVFLVPLSLAKQCCIRAGAEGLN